MTNAPSGAEAHFRAVAPTYMRRLLGDFAQLTDLDAAAVFGNAGHESRGLTDDQEDAPTVPGSRGGGNWMQWTGVRRRQLEAFATEHALDENGDEVAYLFIVEELRGAEAAGLKALARASTLKGKVEAFCRSYLRPGKPHYASRLRWAQVALEAFRGVGVPAQRWPTEQVRAVQQALWDKGYKQVGMVDGKFGRDTRAAIVAFELDHDIPTIGEPTHDVLAQILAAPTKPVSETRADATPADVRDAVPEAKATWQAKVGAFWGMISAFVMAVFGWIVDNFDAARTAVQPALNLLGDVPMWAYIAIFACGLLFVWLRTRSADLHQVAAFRSGERR